MALGLPAVAAAEPLYGVSTTATVSDADLAMMGGGGVDVLRLPISWASVQPTEGGSYDWRSTDDAVVRATDAGIDIVPYLIGTPPWAGGCKGAGSCGLRPPRTEAARAAWRLFVSAAVHRYGPGGTLAQGAGTSPTVAEPITRWQVWDQPNSPSFAGKDAGPRKFARLLDITQQEVRNVDPQAQILLGALSLAPTSGRALSAPRFLRALLARGTAASFSAVALAPRTASLPELEIQVREVRRVLTEADQSAKRTWITPIGWSSAGGGSTMAVGVRGQRRLLGQSFRLLRGNAERWRVDGVIWSAWRDGGRTPGCRWCPRSGLLRASGKPKPSWRAFRRIAGSEGSLAPDAVPAPAPSFFGVVPAGTLTASDMTLMDQANVGTVRFIASWQAVQATRDGPFNWGYLDKTFEQLALAGIEPLPVLNGLPDFAGGITDPETLAGWRAFAGAAAERYGDEGSFWASFTESHPGVAPAPVNVWEIWNEENAADFWPGGAPSPAEYAKLLGVSAEAIRGADPQAEIMTGGMFGTPFGAGGIEAGAFLSRLYNIDGAAQSFDVVALHPYSYDIAGIEKQYRSIRDAMTAANDGATDTWVTELGWSSVPDPGPYSRTPQGQAEMLTKAGRFLLANRERWQIRGMVWYSWRDADPGSFVCSFCQDSGLLEHNLTPKPSLAAFVALTGGSVP